MDLQNIHTLCENGEHNQNQSICTDFHDTLCDLHIMHVLLENKRIRLKNIKQSQIELVLVSYSLVFSLISLF